MLIYMIVFTLFEALVLILHDVSLVGTLQIDK